MKDIDFYLGRSDVRAVIFGGAGAEHGISRMSAFGFICEAERLGFCILPIFVGKNGDFFVYLGDVAEISRIERELPCDALVPTFPIRLPSGSGFLCGGRLIGVSLAVPVLHGDFGEDGRVQGLLECAGIPFVGADTVSGAVMSDKAHAKAVASSVGVRTLPWITLTRESYLEDRESAVSRVTDLIGLPAFIKPTGLGSSIGASAAFSRDAVSESLGLAFSAAGRVMAEPALVRFRELECAYLDISDRCVITHPAEVSVRDGFYGYDKKYFNTDGVRLTVRAEIDGTVADQIRRSTAQLAEALGARHIARFDYFLAEDGTLYFNEVNSFPGLTSGSLYTRMLAECGIEYGDFVKAMLRA